MRDKIRKFFYALLLHVYHGVGWAVRKVKPVQEVAEKATTPAASASQSRTKTNSQAPNPSQLVADHYEPKRSFRWLLEVPGLDSFIMKSVSRPKLPKTVLSVDHLEVELYDPIIPSASHKIWEWINSVNDERNAELKLLDPVGAVIERWKYTNVNIAYVDFGKLEYSKSDPCIIKLKMDYDSVDLLMPQNNGEVLT